MPAIVLVFYLLSACQSPFLFNQESPFLRLLRANGFDLPGDVDVQSVFSISIDRESYSVLRYRTQSVEGLQIAKGNVLVNDPDLAYRILLTYAWSRADLSISRSEVDALQLLLDQLRRSRERFRGLFGLGRALDPLIQAIDRLKDRPVYGVPRLEIRGFPVFEINDMWDLICIIPIDATTACLLEPPLREIRDQAKEVEQLLNSATEDLDRIVVLLRLHSSGQIQDGLALKETSDKAQASLENLGLKATELAGKVASAQELNRKVVNSLQNKKWGTVATLVFNQIARMEPQFDIKVVTSELVSQLGRVDEQLENYHIATEALEKDLDVGVRSLEQARTRTDKAVREFGRQWRLRPTSNQTN